MRLGRIPVVNLGWLVSAATFGFLGFRKEQYVLVFLLALVAPYAIWKVKWEKETPSVVFHGGVLSIPRPWPWKTVEISTSGIQTWKFFAPTRELTVTDRSGATRVLPIKAVPESELGSLLDYLESLAPGRRVY